MAKSSKDYFGLGKVVSIILAIIPFTAWLLGAITRLQEGKLVAGILRLIPIGGLLLWLVDLVCIITNERICRILNA